MGRFLRIVKELAVLVLIGISGYVVVEVATFTTEYNAHWREVFTSHDKYHEQQKILSIALISQDRWARQAEYNLTQLQHTHNDLIRTERKLRTMEKEHYHFMRTLEEIDPDALEKTLDRIKQPRLVIPFFNIPQEKEDGQCEENSSN